ncbi:MAG TPA: cation-transporting P-type ATPase, partial [Burkholderiaceae bacterium]|nr:cation-transporting P-type ATPase [Burkholderiaceae bacterium]
MTTAEHNTPWHTQPADHALAALQTPANGLSAAEAATRLAHHGPNRLPAPPKQSVLVRFLRHFHNILIYVLLGAAALTAALGHVADTFVILAVVIVNAVIGFIQEGKAEKAMAAIGHMLALQASVWRDGARHTIAADALVPGDIVLLEAG